MREPDIRVGGTSGGITTFLGGAALSLTSAWFFIDSVRVTSRGYGWISGAFGSTTGSAGIVFLPLFVGVVALFVDASKKWAWMVFCAGIAVLMIEILSRLSFWFDLKLSHFMIMLVGFAAGLGMLIRSFKAMPPEPPTGPTKG
jgi:hypothetical protein